MKSNTGRQCISRTHLILSLVSAVPELEVPMSRRLVLVPSPLAVAGVTRDGPRPGTPEGTSGTICTATLHRHHLSLHSSSSHVSLSLGLSFFQILCRRVGRGNVGVVVVVVV